MSNNSGDEDDERFYESLDRIPSASSSGSTSDDDVPSSSSQHMAASSMYDVWISEPSSIEERRKRLLQHMGLSGDRSLSRKESTSSSTQSRRFRDGEIGRSASYEEIHTQQHQDDDSNSVVIVRSRSDGSATTSDSNSDSLLNNHCNSPIHSIHSIQSIRSFQPIQSESDTAFVPSFVHNHRHSFRYGSLAASVVSPNKPPIGRSLRRVEEIRGDNLNLNTNGNANPDSPVSPANDAVDGGDPDVNEHVLACTIKNLDNGEEFVVKEVGEDGMWNQLREVGTGRQLTMEEFEMSVGHSPIVQELMRRQNAEALGGKKDGLDSNGSCSDGLKSKKKGSWFKSIRNAASTVTGHKDRRSSDERDTSSEKGGRRSSSATDDSQDILFHTPVKIKVRQYGKSCRELTALYMSQEIHAHKGSIWSIKFSLDGRHLASAGEDRVIHVWQVMESERKGDLLTEKPEEGNSNPFFAANGSPEPTLLSSNADSHLERKKRGKGSNNRRFLSSDHLVMPDNMFALSEKPVCSFRGHLDDVLDLSWSRGQSLLSSSMDKTVRLWDMSSNSCLKIFSHSDYVTCIQFNPVDDNYFISGSLDAKVRIWSIRDRQVVDYNDLHEMVTAACYTPDGQGALVGSYKGNCRLYNTSDNKLQQKSQIDLHNKKKKSHLKKITGFQFAPGSSSEALITSADSRIRVIDGADLVHKFKGFRNTNSQISASLTANGKYVISASEDSHVYVWRYDGDSHAGRSKGVTVARSYELFPCEDVSVAIPWPGICTEGMQETCSGSGEQNGAGYHQDKVSTSDSRVVLVEEADRHKGGPQSAYGCTGSLLHTSVPNLNITSFSDRVSATWPEEKLVLTTNKPGPQGSGDFGCWRMQQGKSAWGMVIVTAGLGGKIKTFQNFGLQIRI